MLYLIGGASRAGKSMLARRLLVEHGVPGFPLDAFMMAAERLPGHGFAVQSGDSAYQRATALWPFTSESVSYTHLPITVLTTLPSAGVGALLALLALRMDFSLIALIGIFLLIGIVKKNAILIIDFALEAERTRGLSATEAVREACLMRFRPILMTTLAAALGALPLAIGFGQGAELRQPLGVAIIGGLIASQLLTLLTTPVVYVLMDKLRRPGTFDQHRSHAIPTMALSNE